MFCKDLVLDTLDPLPSTKTQYSYSLRLVRESKLMLFSPGAYLEALRSSCVLARCGIVQENVNPRKLLQRVLENRCDRFLLFVLWYHYLLVQELSSQTYHR